MKVDFLSIFVLLILFGVLFTAIKLFGKKLPGFLTRKIFHAVGGLICCFGAIICPTYIEGCLAAIAALAAVISLRVFSKHGLAEFLYAGNDSKSMGDILFPVSILLLAWVTKINHLTFILPVLIMSIADCSAACVGKAYGETNLAGEGEERKTVAGSVTFFIVSFIASVICNTSFTYMNVSTAVAVSFIIALCCTLVEMFSSRGTDNILVPATAYLLISNIKCFSSTTLLLLCAVMALLFATCIIAKTLEITTLYRAAKFSVLFFISLVFIAVQQPLALAFSLTTLATVLFINSKAMKSAMGTVFFSIALATVFSAFPSLSTSTVSLVFIIGNIIVAACTMHPLFKTKEVDVTADVVFLNSTAI